jgi:hypothetical protein
MGRRQSQFASGSHHRDLVMKKHGESLLPISSCSLPHLQSSAIDFLRTNRPRLAYVSSWCCLALSIGFWRRDKGYACRTTLLLGYGPKHETVHACE